ncbi:MAG: hypothetical protein AAGN66_20760 [Acidobacteriota bacterium]
MRFDAPRWFRPTAFARTVCLAGLLVLPAIPASANGGGHGFSSTSVRPPLRPSRPSAVPPRAPRSQGPQHSLRNRRLISPMGSASNLPRGYYDHHMSHRGPVRHSPLYYPQPYVVYVGSPEQAIDPPVYRPPAPRQPAPQQAPAPVVIVNQIPTPQPQAPRVQAPPPLPVPPVPRSTEPGPVSLSVVPADADVFLDGDSLGTAATAVGDLSELPPGVYILEVTHAEHRDQRLVFGVNGGEAVKIDIDLTATQSWRRARVR